MEGRQPGFGTIAKGLNSTSIRPMTGSSAQLDYERVDPARRRRMRRRVLLIVSLALITAGAWWRGPAVYRYATRLYREHQVYTYTAPADRVVYEEDPARWPALLAQPAYHNAPYIPAVQCPFIAHFVEPVKQFAEATQLRIGDIALFAHSRRTQSGKERLVIVWIPNNGTRMSAQGASPDNQARFFDLCTSVYGGPKFLAGGADPWIAPQSLAENRQTPLYARIYAGQIDPADASHFTIPYQIGDYTDFLDGYLRDDESVLLRPHNYFHPMNPK
jgi:hypothetical protein